MKNIDFQKIIEFIKNNKLFVAMGALVTVIFLIMIFASPKNNPNNLVSPTYAYYTTNDFKVVIDNGDITVQVFNPNMNDKELIRKTLNIPVGVDFTIDIPGAALDRGDNADYNYENESLPLPTDNPSIGD